jgi:hypothetical protein
MNCHLLCPASDPVEVAPAQRPTFGPNKHERVRRRLPRAFFVVLPGRYELASRILPGNDGVEGGLFIYSLQLVSL